MRIAAISDIHGNLGALEAVLADIRHRRADIIVNLGDVLSGPLSPSECADRLLPLGIPTIRGNHERQLLTLTEEQMGESERYTASRLRPDHIKWIGQFPATLQIFDDVLLVHGIPDDDLCYFLETVDPAGARAASQSEVRYRAGRTSAALILCGHSHIPRIFCLDRNRLIVSSGSVGLPAYTDDHPFPHKMQAGSHMRVTPSWNSETDPGQRNFTMSSMTGKALPQSLRSASARTGREPYGPVLPKWRRS